MNNAFRFNPLKLVDIAITNARTAGHEPDQNTIALFWKIARGCASDEDVKTLCPQSGWSISDDNHAQYSELMLQDIEALRRNFVSAIESLTKSLMQMGADYSHEVTMRIGTDEKKN